MVGSGVAHGQRKRQHPRTCYEVNGQTGVSHALTLSCTVPSLPVVFRPDPPELRPRDAACRVFDAVMLVS